jgi:hypothetical protein
MLGIFGFGSEEATDVHDDPFLLVLATPRVSPRVIGSEDSAPEPPEKAAEAVPKPSVTSPWEVFAKMAYEDVNSLIGRWQMSGPRENDEAPVLSPRQHLASNGEIIDDYDPRKPEYIIPASHEEQLLTHAVQLDGQIFKLQSLVNRLERTRPESSTNVHYRKVLEDLRMEQRDIVQPESTECVQPDVNVVQCLDTSAAEGAIILRESDMSSLSCLGFMTRRPSWFKKYKSPSALSTCASSMSMLSSNPSFCFSEQSQEELHSPSVDRTCWKISEVWNDHEYDEELQEEVFLSAMNTIPSDASA